MDVRVKYGMKGFIYGELRIQGEKSGKFTLIPVEATDSKGNEITISVDDQFSPRWMEKVKSPGRPKKVSNES